MGNALINSLGLMVVGAALSFLAASFWFRKNKLEKEKEVLAIAHEKLETRVRDLEGQLGKVNQAITPISAAFQAILIKELTHFHTPEMDALMVKLGPPITLEAGEEARLETLLRERSKDLNGRISDAERDAAVMLPMVIKRVRMENETLAKTPNTELQIVAVVTDAEDVKPETPSVAGKRGLDAFVRRATDAARAVTQKKAQEGSGPGIGDGKK